MSVRRTMGTRGRMAAVAITAGLVVTVAGCGGGDDGGGDAKPSASSDKGKGGESSEGDSGGKLLAEVKGGDSITLKINSAKREEGGFVTVTGTVTNGSGNIWVAPRWQGDETELSEKNEASVAGAKLVDKDGRKRYYVLRDTEGRCLCTAFQQGFKSGETRSWYAQFPAPPSGNDTVDFQIADMPPANVRLSGGE